MQPLSYIYDIVFLLVVVRPLSLDPNMQKPYFLHFRCLYFSLKNIQAIILLILYIFHVLYILHVYIFHLS